MRNKSETNLELPDFLSKKQVAGYFDVSTKTVERMMRHGLKGIRIRNKLYFTKSQLHDYVNKNKTA